MQAAGAARRENEGPCPPAFQPKTTLRQQPPAESFPHLVLPHQHLRDKHQRAPRGAVSSSQKWRATPAMVKALIKGGT